TFFEITTVAAFVAFARHPADVAILEVGMGGQRDTTNVVDPALCAITPIGYDHTGFLGEKLEGIAAEKAGILKRAVPAVVGRRRDPQGPVVGRLAGQAAEAHTRPVGRVAAAWLRAVARWRSQRRLRAGAGPHGERLGQGAGAAAALSHLRHAYDQGRLGLPAA